MNHSNLRSVILAALAEHQPITGPELAKKLERQDATVHWHIQALHRMNEIYVAQWYPPTFKGRVVRGWAVGNQADAPKPKPGEFAHVADVAKLRKEWKPKTPEELERIEEERLAWGDAERKRRILALNVIRRDPMLFMTAGVAP